MADLLIDKNFIKVKNDLKEIEKRAPGKIYERMDKLGDKIKKDSKEITPFDSTKKKPAKKHMKNRWKMEKTKKSENGYVTKIYSSAPHFHLVEKGHHVVPRRATVNKKTGEQNRVKHSKSAKTYVQGSHFFEKAMDKKEKEIQSEMEKIYEALLEDAFGSW